MMLDLCWSGLVSTACCSVCLGGGCGTLGLVGGGMVGTLLGPEASGPCLFACLLPGLGPLWGLGCGGGGVGGCGVGCFLCVLLCPVPGVLVWGVGGVVV